MYFKCVQMYYQKEDKVLKTSNISFVKLFLLLCYTLNCCNIIYFLTKILIIINSIITTVAFKSGSVKQFPLMCVNVSDVVAMPWDYVRLHRSECQNTPYLQIWPCREIWQIYNIL